jgi:hypothetical protein
VLAKERVWTPLAPSYDLGLRRTNVNCYRH